MFNRIVASVCKHGICHAELVFEDNMAFSIYAGHQVFFKPRTLSNPEYELITLTVTEGVHKRLQLLQTGRAKLHRVYRHRDACGLLSA
jgi:hypothetical protein